MEKLEAKVEDDMKKAIEEMTHQRDHLLKQVNNQYKSLCEELNKKQDNFKSDLTISKQLVEDATLCIEKLLKQTESWHEPVKGIPESRIVNCEELIADVKEEVPSVDLDITEPRIKFVSGDDDTVLGKFVDEEVNVDVQPTLKYEIETEDDITDIDYLDNGYLVVCMSKGVCVYNGGHLVPDHYLAVHCRPSGKDELWSVCVCMETGQVVVSESGVYQDIYMFIDQMLRDGSITDMGCV